MKVTIVVEKLTAGFQATVKGKFGTKTNRFADKSLESLLNTVKAQIKDRMGVRT